MKKNFYTVFFASERNDYSRSIQISKLSIIIIMFFLILIIVFAFIGSLRLFQYSMINSEIRQLREKNLVLQNYLNDFEFSNMTDSTKSYEEFIVSYYDNKTVGYPSFAPVSGYVTRGVNLNKMHYGIDIAAKFQDKIFSPAFGTVIFSGANDDLGNTIVVNHPGGFVTVYAHNDSNYVSSGDQVEQGQLLASVGETGNSQGPHLHFEIWKNNKVIDPRDIIKEYKKKDVSIR